MKVGKEVLSVCLFLSILIQVRGQNALTMEHIWSKGTFTPKKIESIYWFKDSKSFAGLNGNRIMQFFVDQDSRGKVLLDGNEINLVISDFSFNSEENKVLFLANKQKIWRRSFFGEYFIYDLDAGTLKPLADQGRQAYATFSPDGKKVAFVRDNDLFIKVLEKGEEKRITGDGSPQGIVNGAGDWVYEEEFEMTRAFCWSPESDKLAYLKFDQDSVPLYPIQKWNGLYTEIDGLKYPKPGENISRVKLIIYHLEDEKEVEVNLGAEPDIYIPSLQWTRKNDILSAFRLNRAQDKLEVLHIGAHSGMAQIILIDAARTYVDFNFLNELTYLKDGESFIYPSEKSGYKHYFHFDMSGNLLRQVTSGEWEVDELISADSKSGLLYYTSTEDSPLERHLYEISLKGKKKRKVSTIPGWHKVQISPDGKYYLDQFSNLSTAPSLSIFSTGNSKSIVEIESNPALEEKRLSFGLRVPELIQFETVDSVFLNGYVITPGNMQPENKYPVLIYVYGGPGSQKVRNEWLFEKRELWHQYMVQKGYVVYCFDNRGTGGRGVEFKKMVFRNLGKLESDDQIHIAKEIREIPFVDSARIGIWGWSYGGYMSAICKFLEPELFRLAVSVAPVSHWKFYDAVYTERYMGKPKKNPQGYDAFCPLNLAEKLKGDFLLIHAGGDDNVHIQNSMELAQKLIDEEKPFDFFVYPSGDHSINTGKSREHVYQKISDYLIEKL
jgi:dipeptidyl-peptidase 4